MSGEAPLIAVLPFSAEASASAATTSGQEDEILASALAEDVSRELTRFRTLGVVAPASARAVAALPDPEIGQRLGATHVFRGRLQRHAGGLRVLTTLVECDRGAQIWTDEVVASESDLAVVRDDLVARIAATLTDRVQHAAVVRAQRRPETDLAAYELTARGFLLLREGTLEADETARRFFRKAIQRDPAQPRAYAGMSLSWFNEWGCQYWELMEETGCRAYEWAHRALQLDDRDGMLHFVIGRICLYRRQFEQAAWYFDRSLALCPNDADLLIQLAVADAYLGRRDFAVEHANRALRLNPYHPNGYYAYAAQAYLIARDLPRALQLAAKVDRHPFVDGSAYVAIALAHLGRPGEAREHLRAYHREYERAIASAAAPDPGGPVAWFLQVNPYRLEEDREFFVEGFRILGEAIDSAQAARGTPAAGDPPEHEDGNILALDGNVWRVRYAGLQASLPDIKGLHDLERLLSRPGQSMHSLDLTGRGADAFDGEPVLDERARTEIKARIRDLQQEIDEAEPLNDSARALRAREEMEALLETLSGALGLAGRDRRLGDMAERARSTVTWRIRHAIKKVEAVHPQLGRHLANSIRTGAFCSYEPEGRVSWKTTSTLSRTEPAPWSGPAAAPLPGSVPR